MSACLYVWVEDPVDVAEQGAPAAAGAGGGLVALFGLLVVQKLLMPLVDLLLASHEVVLPQDDVALVVLHQQPLHGHTGPSKQALRPEASDGTFTHQ